MASLLLGCGNSREKKIYLGSDSKWSEPLTTIDMNPDCGADHVFDIGARMEGRIIIAPGGKLPFLDEGFDEIGAYDVLEHWGRQGDWRQWFDEAAEYHRILKPGGTMGILVPIGDNALSDPGHTRLFHRNHFGFLCQKFYEANKATAATDYRWYWKLNFDVIYMEEQPSGHLAVLLQKA